MPLDPACIGSLWLEELHALRNRVRCKWLRHGSMLFVTGRNRALLREARVTVEWRQTACGRGIASLAAVGFASFLVFSCNIHFFCFLLGGDECGFGVAVVFFRFERVRR